MMTRNEIIEKINETMINEFEIPADKIKPEAKIVDDLGLDSLDAVDMLVFLEDAVNTRLETEKFKQARTLNDIYDLVFEVLNTPKN